MKSFQTLGAAAVFCAGLLASGLFAEDAKPDDKPADKPAEKPAEKPADAGQAKTNADAAVAAAAAGSSAVFSRYTGKLTLFTQAEIDAGGDATVIGKFVIDNDTHLIQPVNVNQKDKLKEVDGTEVTVSARMRNNGKYILIEKVILPGPANAFISRRGGL